MFGLPLWLFAVLAVAGIAGVVMVTAERRRLLPVFQQIADTSGGKVQPRGMLSAPRLLLPLTTTAGDRLDLTLSLMSRGIDPYANGRASYADVTLPAADDELNFRLRDDQRSLQAKLDKYFEQRVTAGDAEFDARFRFAGKPIAALKQLLVPALQRQLLAFAPASCAVNFQNKRLTVAHAGVLKTAAEWRHLADTATLFTKNINQAVSVVQPHQSAAE